MTQRAIYIAVGAVIGVAATLLLNTGLGAMAAKSSSRPAYLVVLGDVYDRDAFMTGYTAELGPLYEKYGGEYLAVGRNKDVLENGAEFQSFVITKWPSMEAARAFWSDPEYEKLKADRIDQNWSRFDVYLLEGLPEAVSE